MASQKVKDLYVRYLEEETKAQSAAILLKKYPELSTPELEKEEELK